MECANPSYLKNGRIYHWTNPDLTYPAQKINCRKCIACRKSRGAELADCCVLENDTRQSSYFITLTKRPEYEAQHPKYDKQEITRFIRNLRLWSQRKNGITPKIYRVHEHGKLGRSHYHIIAFDLILHDLVSTPRLDTLHSNTIEQKWGHGHITVQTLNHATAMYQSLYLDKDLKNGHANSDKKAISWHSGIGTSYFLKNYKQILQNGFILREDGRKMKIPRKFTRLAQKHLDAITLTNEQFCWKYSKEHCKKVIYGEASKLCMINIIPNKELAELYYYFKTKERDEKKNIERLQQIHDYNFGIRKNKPDFYLAGQNALHDQKNKIEKDRL